MANTLTNLIPDIYAALDVVSRELVGFIPSVARDATADRVALNQNLRIEQTPRNTAGRNITPAMSFPAAADQTITPATLTITKQRAYPFNWSGEEQKAVDFGPGYLTIKQDQIAQAIRALTNEMETDIFNAFRSGVSRASGTGGATPFGTAGDLSDIANLRKILDDNGAPASDRWFVLNTTAGANLRGKQSILTKVNESGTDSTLRQGVLLDVFNFGFRESAVISQVAKGGGSAYTTTAAGFAVGTTSIPLITGSGTILAGDVIQFGGTTGPKYVVATGIGAPGTIVLNPPGLITALPASTQAVSLETTSPTANIGFSRNAFVLACRLPAYPDGGDLATDRMTVTDPRSGISLEIAQYPGYRMVVYEVSACWGVLALKPEHAAILMG
jgi:P22 coat protein - gene protein 5.